MIDRPLRSLLYLPASNPRAVAKARTLDADAVILDLEDAVAPDAKPAARDAAAAAVREGGWGARAVIVRVNGLSTSWGADDFAALAGLELLAVQVPKVDGPADAAAAVAAAGGLPVFAMIETPRGVLSADAIAAVPGVTALVAGMADLAKELRARPGPDRVPLLYALSRIVLAARASGILAFDGVFTAIHDLAGLEAEARQGLALGFDGKTLVHPGQIEATNRVFSPSPEELAEAAAVIAAYEAGLAAGTGVTTLRGRMVEVLHVAEARRLLATAAAIASS